MWSRGPPKAIKACGSEVTLPWKHDYSTFTDRVICGLRGKLSHYGGALRCLLGPFIWHEIGY